MHPALPIPEYLGSLCTPWLERAGSAAGIHGGYRQTVAGHVFGGWVMVWDFILK